MKTLSKEELDNVLEQHKLWLDTEGDEGAKANLSNTDLSEMDLSKANLIGADLSLANLSEAGLYRVNLSKANLHGANLSKTDLSWANLSLAKLHEANLSNADLHGANISDVFDKEIITFQGSKHFAYYADGLVKIGCMCNTLEYWLENYENIGKSEGYSPRDIEVYGEWLWFIDREVLNNE